MDLKFSAIKCTIKLIVWISVITSKQLVMDQFDDDFAPLQSSDGPTGPATTGWIIN